MTLHELSLFSGYGGFTLGLKLARIPVRTVAYVEIEEYCQEIVKARIQDGYLDDAPIFPDICAFDGQQCRGLVDILTAGFPCQPHSVAGQRRGESDERNLWPDTARVISEVAPGLVLLENVPGLLSDGYALQVVGDLTQMGYDCRWGIVGARHVGASHRRDRWWCLGVSQWDGTSRESRMVDEAGQSPMDDTKSKRWGLYNTENKGQALRDVNSPTNPGNGEYWDVGNTEGDIWGTPRNDGHQPSDGTSDNVANTTAQRLQDRGGFPLEQTRGTESKRLCGVPRFPPGPNEAERWGEVLKYEPSLEPAVRGVADGSPHRVDRLKALGNGIVPAVVAEFLRLWLTTPTGLNRMMLRRIIPQRESPTSRL